MLKIKKSREIGDKVFFFLLDRKRKLSLQRHKKWQLLDFKVKYRFASCLPFWPPNKPLASFSLLNWWQIVQRILCTIFRYFLKIFLGRQQRKYARHELTLVYAFLGLQHVWLQISSKVHNAWCLFDDMMIFNWSTC